MDRRRQRQGRQLPLAKHHRGPRLCIYQLRKNSLAENKSHKSRFATSSRFYLECVQALIVDELHIITRT